MSQLSVRISIKPQPSEIRLDELNTLFAGEVKRFEEWFVAQQQKGGLGATGLVSSEHAILRSYMYFITTTQGPSDVKDQAQ